MFKLTELNRRKKIFSGLCAVIVPFFLTAILAVSSVFAAGQQNWPEAPETLGESVVLMEANTQAVIYEKNPEAKMYPASTTKILTAIVVLENCSLDETVVFTEECCDLEEGAVTIDSVPGEQMRLKDVMYGLLLPSGNDCAMALALHVAGSVSAFVDMMNEKAVEIGALSSHFMNPSGLFHSNHYTTAADMATIARYAFQNSTFLDIISHPNYIIEPTNMNPESRVLINTHEMITPGNPDYDNHVIGGKTGYLYESGRCLVTYAEKDGITLLCVILDGSYYGIFTETEELLQFGWNNFKIINASEEERRFSYADETAKVQLDSSNQILMLNNVPFYELTSKINYAYYLDEKEYAEAKLEAGIENGDPRQLYAWIDYYYGGHYLGKCNVFVNPDLHPPTASFIKVVYVNIWLIILVIVVVAVLVILLVHLAKKSAANEGRLSAWEHRKSGRKQTRYYSRSDSIDLREQYIKSGHKDKESIHGLSNLGVPYSRKDQTVGPIHPQRSTAADSHLSGSSGSSSGSRPSGSNGGSGGMRTRSGAGTRPQGSTDRSSNRAVGVRTGSSQRNTGARAQGSQSPSRSTSGTTGRSSK
ncbi:MAG: D-alanyl-D-alanine carboxypeptidase [Parasporobacterium sp.]|nr:D-alanyl-D-alanine carboxypeptidase [Parasporobacterium sp.]